jgi:hypothetical protein
MSSLAHVQELTARSLRAGHQESQAGPQSLSTPCPEMNSRCMSECSVGSETSEVDLVMDVFMAERLRDLFALQSRADKKQGI